MYQPIKDGDHILVNIWEYHEESNQFHRWARAFKIESITNNGTIKARNRNHGLLWTHQNQVLRYVSK